MRIVAVGLGLSLWVWGAFAQAPAKKRVAVFDFDNAAIQGGVSSPFLQTGLPNVGKAVADLLVNQLVKNGTVTIIERSAIDKLLAEQNLSNSDRTDPQTAARLGRILGVDAIILGTITHFDYEDKVTGGGGNALGGFIGRTSMSTKHDIRAKVQVTARLVSPDTAEVLAVSEGVGEIVRKGVKVDMRDTSSTVAMMSGNANNPIMNEAKDQAIVKLATQIEQNVPRIPPRNPVIEGLVADVNESGRLVLNIGSKNGLKAGDRVQVWRQGKEIRDPETGKVLLRDDTLLGEALVNTVNEGFSVAAYQGKEPVQTGDRVKSVAKQ